MNHALSPVRSQWAQHTAELRVRLGRDVCKHRTVCGAAVVLLVLGSPVVDC